MTQFLIWCAALLASVFADADSGGNDLVRVPLVHMESGLQKLLRQEADLQLIEGLYNMCKEKARPILTSKEGKPIPSNDTLNLFKYFETEYYGVINVGKPGKAFKMILDTAWGYSWLPSFDCPRTSLPCAIHNKYNHAQSFTYKPDGRTFNISNDYVGYLSMDLFHVGHLDAQNQTFAELTKIPFIHTLYETDGILGMGLKDLSPNVLPFFYNFVQKNHLKQIFSLYINRDPTTTRGGSLFFGGIDYTHNKTAFNTIDMEKDSPYWTFNMQKVSLISSKKSHEDFCKSGCRAFADTSSNTIVGPAEEIKRINQLIGAEEIFFSDRYMIPCVNEHKGPKVNFTIAGKDYMIKAQDYIQRLSYSGVTICLSAFQPADPKLWEKNTWSLGGAFLYRYYVAFDVEHRQIKIADVS